MLPWVIIDDVAMYDAFATAYDAHARDSAYNAHYDRPAVLRLLGPVNGLDVLDAGCGSGLYAEQLLAGGARVVGVDASHELIRLARQRTNDAAEFHVHDLNAPMRWAASKSFDRIVMALVLHHLDDPVSALRELHRVLSDDGQLVTSTLHPTSDWLRLGGSYFTDERLSETWNDGWDVTFRRAPLQAIVADFAAAGFTVDSLVEPRPARTMQRDHPELYRRLLAEPAFIAFRLSKRPHPTAR